MKKTIKLIYSLYKKYMIWRRRSGIRKAIRFVRKSQRRRRKIDRYLERVSQLGAYEEKGAGYETPD